MRTILHATASRLKQYIHLRTNAALLTALTVMLSAQPALVNTFQYSRPLNGSDAMSGKGIAAEDAKAESIAADETGSADKAGARKLLESMPLCFIENRGQLDNRVAYYVQGKTTSVYFTSRGLTFSLTDPADSIDALEKEASARPAKLNRAQSQNLQSQKPQSTRWVVKLDFIGANPSARPVAVDEAPGVISYFRGKQSEWKAGVRTFSRLVYRNLWPGIDLEYSGTVNHMKHAFILNPGADPNKIKLAYQGATSVGLDESGRMEVVTPVGSFNDEKPYSYQETGGRRADVATVYALKGAKESGRQEYGFALGEYDKSKQLVIDPAMRVYCGYIGGNSSDDAGGVAVDSAGNAYVVGNTSSPQPSFPVRVGPDLTHGAVGITDAFIAKVNATGTALVYCGYIGGGPDDSANGVAVDSAGNAYVVGKTNSSTGAQGFPAVVGPDLTYNSGIGDAFVAKVNAAGTALLYCGYIGGGATDSGNAIAIDSAGNAYVTGETASTEAQSFPVTVGPDATFNGFSDIFVAKVIPSGASLAYCGYVGGTSSERGKGIAVDSGGNAYVTGDTFSSQADGFPVAVGPDITFNTSDDVFVAKVNPVGDGLSYCGYIGGVADDVGRAIAVDAAGNAYVTGYTDNSENNGFPVAVGPDLTYNGSRDAFVARVNADGAGLGFCGYVGGSNADHGNGIALDPLCNIYIAGESRSSQTQGFPVLLGPDLTYNGGVNDGFVAEINASGTTLIYSGYVGGSDVANGIPNEYCTAIAVDPAGNAYVVGHTSSTQGDGFPVTVGPDLTYNGFGTDSFVAMISAVPSLAELASFTAKGDESGRVLLEWRTGKESDNLGFNLYREEADERIKITRDLIAGAALLAGPGAGISTGHSYAWIDRHQGDNGAVYWLEEVDLKGESTWHGPVAIDRASDTDFNKQPSPLLSYVGSNESTMQGMHGSQEEPLAQQTEMTASGFATQASLASQKAVKLSIKEEGWYRVTREDLARAGLDGKFDPRNLQMFVGAKEIPFLVTGEEDGRFDSSDAIEFYGIGLNSTSTAVRTYWLAVGSEAGKRIKKTKGRKTSVTAASFQSTIVRKDRVVYFSSLKNGEAENFFGAIVSKNPVDQLMRLPDPAADSAGAATLEVKIQGVTDALHYVKCALNGTDLGAAGFYGQGNSTASFEVSQSKLRPGDNVVTLAGQAGDEDVCLVDSIRLTYWRSYRAENNTLRLSPSAKQKVTISGFTTSDIRLIDVTDPDEVQEVRGAVRPDGSGFAVTANSPKSGRPTWLAFSDAQAKKPALIAANEPSSLHKTGQGGDLVIITGREFLQSLGPLKALRESQGLSVTVVDVEDIYDEFSYGEKSPAAVRDFLSYAKESWNKPPRFALLVGDASLDPKNYLGFGDGDFVPTKPLDTQFLETASDEWLADFDRDGVADIAIGRLPVRTLEEATQVVSKIVGYDQSAAPDGVLLVSDSNVGFDFEAASEELKSLIPGGVRVEEIHRGRLGTAAAKINLLGAVGRGQKIVNYTGHGNIDQWTGDLLSTEDTRAMTNGGSLPLFVTMTCLNGYFHDPALESLAEGLLKAKTGGAIAVWSSTGMTNPAVQAMMNREFFRRIFGGESLTLGEAIAKAKMSIEDKDIRRTWILLGDPATKLR